MARIQPAVNAVSEAETYRPQHTGRSFEEVGQETA